ncbi:DUF2141 domain-containing protein [Rivularia sp. UHCC 0363]|uniref:DUF2141 domain-containing protein n=1 Tax=Rivularia sp. UHCC 0363 TaxID=3110244 RepID=UPI002B1EBA65|nr:DUF2141 domain-containing protein [Rivularia sp. UHCC 0363]MEA5597070.1 DUF2141 domain-containing protein [Rivularia sp. UHCC 0363]
MNLLKNKFHVGIVLLSMIGNLAFLPSAEGSANSNLGVTVKGLKNQKGQVCFSLFSSSRGFPSNDKRAIKAQCVKLGDSNVKLNIPSLKAGTYAIAMFHDSNGDGKLNTNGLGIPKEGFGFSRNPRILTGPPKFGDSAVFVVGSSTNIEIDMNYFFGG